MIYPIQALRGLAAMLVVLHHALEMVPASPLKGLNIGGVGVDIFFVISGFIIETSFLSKPSQSAGKFFLRRFIRVVPLYWFFTIIVVLLSIKKGILLDWLAHVMPSLLFIPHYSPTDEGNIWPILVPGWTLNYEMFFYFIFAITIFFRSARRPVLFLCMFILPIIGMIIPQDSAVAITYTSPLLWEFLLGQLIAVWIDKSGMPSTKIIWLLPIGTIALLYGVSCHNKALTIVGASFVVAGSLGITSSVFTQRLPKILILLGDASYSIYLSHTVIFPSIYKYISHTIPDAVAVFISMLICAIVGYLVFLMIEKPMLRLMNGWLERKMVSVNHAKL